MNKRKVSLTAAAAAAAVGIAALAMPQLGASQLVTELWDGVGDGDINGLGDGTTSQGFQPGSIWYANFSSYIKVAQNFDVADGSNPFPGLSPNGGQVAGLWSDVWGWGGDTHLWDTRIWATRQLASSAQINFAGDGVYWLAVRINNGGDSAGGIGLTSAGDGSGEFLGVGAMWNNAGGGKANNAIYISNGTLGSDSPYAIRANSAAGAIDGKGLLLARLTTHATSPDKLEATVVKAGQTLPADPASINWLTSFELDSSMTGSHFLLWMNGTYPFEMDAIRIATTYAEAAALPYVGADLAISPANTVFAGVPVTLKVTAGGGTPLSYEWRKDGTTVATTSVPSYTIASPVVADSGSYDVVVSNAAGTASSTSVSLTVQPANPPTVVADPQSATRYVHGRLLLSVTADGTPPFQYQWIKGETPIDGATASDFRIDDLTAADAGSYKVKIINALGNITSGSATVTVLTPPAKGYAESIMAKRPVGYWRLNEEEALTAVDLAGGNDMTNNAVTATAGLQPPTFPGLEQNNNAASYDGVDSGSGTAAPLMNSMTQFTMCGWFNLAGTPQTARTALFGQNDLAEFGFHGEGQLGIWVANANGGVYVGYDKTSSLVANQWYFVACISDGAKLSMFLNGDYVGVASGGVTNFYNSTSAFRIGSATIDATGNFFSGAIDEVALFDRALSNVELNALYASAAGAVPGAINSDPVSKKVFAGRNVSFTSSAGGTLPLTLKWKKGSTYLANSDRISGVDTTTLSLTGVTAADQGDYSLEVSNVAGGATSLPATLTVLPMTGLSAYDNKVVGLDPVGYWQLDEVELGAANDYWGGNTGTYGAAAVLAANGPQSPDVPGFSTTNTGVECDGITDAWVQLPALNLNTNTITLTGWIHPNGDQGGWRGIIYCRGGTTTAGLNFGDGNELRYVWNNNDSATWSFNSGLNVPVDQWSFVALAVEPTKATFYLGVPGQDLQSSVNTIAHAVTAFDAATYVGQDSQGGRFFNGLLDSVAIFNRTLSAGDIASLSGATIPEVRIAIEKSGADINITWAAGTLESSDTVAGPYTTVANATSPLKVTPTDAGKFYRVKVQ